MRAAATSSAAPRTSSAACRRRRRTRRRARRPAAARRRRCGGAGAAAGGGGRRARAGGVGVRRRRAGRWRVQPRREPWSRRCALAYLHVALAAGKRAQPSKHWWQTDVLPAALGFARAQLAPRPPRRRHVRRRRRARAGRRPRRAHRAVRQRRRARRGDAACGAARAATTKEALRARLALLQGVYPAANVPRHIMKELNNFFVAVRVPTVRLRVSCAPRLGRRSEHSRRSTPSPTPAASTPMSKRACMRQSCVPSPIWPLRPYITYAVGVGDRELASRRQRSFFFEPHVRAARPTRVLEQDTWHERIAVAAATVADATGDGCALRGGADPQPARQVDGPTARRCRAACRPCACSR